MPNTDFKYEEFEGLIASAYLTAKYRHKENTQILKKVDSAIEKIVDYYKIQCPKDVIENPRSNYEWAQPKKLDISAELSYSAWRDFGVRPKTDGFGMILELESLL